MVNYSSNYLNNPLNRYESYTYSWALHMCNPNEVPRGAPALKASNRVITLAESGVENEITIQRVEQNFVLSFVRTDRSPLANEFKIDFVEVAGITFYTRILKAAKELGIKNHLSATYILELNFNGQLEGQPVRNIPEIGTFYYYCVMSALGMSFQDGAAYYAGSLTEINQTAFFNNEFTLFNEIRVEASTFGEFLTAFERELNEQARNVVLLSGNSVYPNSYKLKDNYGASNWKFGAVDPNNADTVRQVSAEGNKLGFVFPKNTSITAAITLALSHTTEQRKLPVGLRGNVFAKNDPNDLVAIPSKYADKLRMAHYETNVLYGNYDPVSNNYAKQITYTVVPVISPRAVNDPESSYQFNTSTTMQKDRLRKYFIEGQLKKKYDYMHTGQNTEVLSMDLSLNHTYYAMQATMQGVLQSAASFFAGQGKTTEAIVSVNLGKLSELKAKLVRKKNELTNLNRSDNSFRPNPYEQRIGELTRDINSIESEIRSLESVTDQALIGLQSVATYGAQPFNNIRRNRYITQSELFDERGFSTNDPILKVSFKYTEPINPVTQGPETASTQDIGQAQAAAVYSNSYVTGDLLEISLSIRGDPYWLSGSNRSAVYNKGGVSFFLNMRVPRYPSDNTGLMDRENFVTQLISGVYVVIAGRATYENGQFIITLSAYKDTSLQTPLVYDLLNQGYVEGSHETGQQPGVVPSTDESVTGNTNPGLRPPDTSITPGATGVSSTGGHQLDSGVNPALNDLLTLSGNQTGVTVVTTSGFRPGPGSGRHLGDASDIALYSGDRRLSVSNAADRAIIATFTQNFVNNATSSGYTPSVGWANHTYPSSEWYMSGNTGHYDIAVGNSIGADRGTYWGGSGSTAHVNPPRWLTDIMP